jgi:hypothetical protein
MSEMNVKEIVKERWQSRLAGSRRIEIVLLRFWNEHVGFVLRPDYGQPL